MLNKLINLNLNGLLIRSQFQFQCLCLSDRQSNTNSNLTVTVIVTMTWLGLDCLDPRPGVRQNDSSKTARQVVLVWYGIGSQSVVVSWSLLLSQCPVSVVSVVIVSGSDSLTRTLIRLSASIQRFRYRFRSSSQGQVRVKQTFTVFCKKLVKIWCKYKLKNILDNRRSYKFQLKCQNQNFLLRK